MIVRRCSMGLIVLLAIFAGMGLWAHAQQARPKQSAPKQEAQPKRSVPAKQQPAAGQGEPRRPAPQPLSAADIAKKNEIIASPRWRRAMFELYEWLSGQQIYDKAQVERIKANFSDRVARMTPDELLFTLADLEAKFKIMETPEAREARAWMGQYLSILADKKREEVVKSLPNFTTMTAVQLNQEVLKIDRERQSFEADLAPRPMPVNPWGQTTLGQQAYIEDHAPGTGGYYSPYNSGSSTAKPFDNVPIGPSIQYNIGGYGGYGISFAPSSW